MFTTAGMQQFSPYLAGEKDVLKDFKARHLISYQKCFRSDDIDEVGDDTHHTFFEMLGNWSIGEDPESGYFKEGAIKLALEFFAGELGLDKNKIWATVFKGEDGIPKDEESIKIWLENGIPKERIREFGRKDNLWGPVGETGVCGPSSEIHYDRGEKLGCVASDCGPNCPNCQRFVELWNLVFMEYYKDGSGNYQRLSQRNVDTGIGFERLVSVLSEKPSAYETDLFLPVIREVEKLSSKPYASSRKPYRVIADHIRSAVFLASDGILPNNLGRGYVLRRILRRAIRYGRVLGMEKGFLIPLAEKTVEIYKGVYPEISAKENGITAIIRKEEEKFGRTLEKGLKQIKKLLERGGAKIIGGKEAFDLYQSYGFPLELTQELAEEKGFRTDKKGFFAAMKRHQEVSRAGAEKKFGGTGAEKIKDRKSKEKVAKLHTATHLLHQALRAVLGEEVKQMGSDITEERLRFDFSYPQKMDEEEIKKVEDLVNQKIRENLEVKKEEMPYEKAAESGALAFFKDKYPEKVTVYSIGNFSKEICAGPHIKRTSELGKFKIVKEKSSGAGVRRIKAILE